MKKIFTAVLATVFLKYQGGFAEKTRQFWPKKTCIFHERAFHPFSIIMMDYEAAAFPLGVSRPRDRDDPIWGLFPFFQRR